MQRRQRSDEVVLPHGLQVQPGVTGDAAYECSVQRSVGGLRQPLVRRQALEDDPARDLGKGRQLGHRFFLSPHEVQPLPDDGPDAPPRRILVAGIGNVFMGDDGFGVEVARRLARRTLPDGVDVVDFGIRGMDLAYALTSGYEAAILVDATARGQPPGTLEVIELEFDAGDDVPVQAHVMDPVRVLMLAARLGPLPAKMLVVGCEPDTVIEVDAGESLTSALSAPVRAALQPAVDLVEALLLDELRPCAQEGGDQP
jgi:hydrogenase maturation protease